MTHELIRQKIVGNPKNGLAGLQDDWWTRISPDLWHSHGTYLRDISGEEFLDLCGFLGTAPLSFDHPDLRDKTFLEQLGKAGFYRPSLSDFWPEVFAGFIEDFRQTAVPPYMNYLYFIEGGALAVENALKTAFDWKVKKNIANGSLKFPVSEKILPETCIIGFNYAFHGRSGYTLSLTKTSDPRKYQYYPRFDWFCVDPPVERYDNLGTIVNLEEISRQTIQALSLLNEYLENHADSVAAIIIEPIQCEGGDRHIPVSFFKDLKTLTDQYGCLLIYDEVQTGFGSTGKMWAHEHFGKNAIPDLLSFAKKAQTSGIMASATKLDEIKDHVFSDSEAGKSRINSTWGGNLVDMLRCKQILKAIGSGHLLKNAEEIGEYFLNGLRDLCKQFSDLIENPRGRGMVLAVDAISPYTKKSLWDAFYHEKLLCLTCGIKTVRFRPHLDLKKTDVNEALKRMANALIKLKQK